MVTNKRNLIFAGLLVLLSCKHPSKDNVTEVRSYLIEGIGKDSIWYDTIYANTKSQNGLKRIIHGIDSTFKGNQIDSFHIDSAEVIVTEKIDTGLYKLIKYHVAFPIEHGTLSFFGIYAKDIGTVYWRWLDGKRSLKLKERHFIDSKYSYADLVNYLDAKVLAVPPRSNADKMRNGEEIEVEIQLDTSLIDLR